MPSNFISVGIPIDLIYAGLEVDDEGNIIGVQAPVTDYIENNADLNEQFASREGTRAVGASLFTVNGTDLSQLLRGQETAPLIKHWFIPMRPVSGGRDSRNV